MSYLPTRFARDAARGRVSAGREGWGGVELFESIHLLKECNMLRKHQLLFLFLVITVPGCSPAATLPPSPIAVTDFPTSTATTQIIPTDTDIPAPTDTPAPTSPPVPSSVMLTFATNAFCRKGPSQQYSDVGSIAAGDTAQADGRSDTVPRWWWVQRRAGGHCWVSDITVQPNAEAEWLPIQAPEYALPQTPPDLWADRICNPKKGGFAVTLNWTPSGTADGYYVYLNSELIQQIRKSTRTSYVIKLPMNQPVSYGMQAYNDVGSGESIIFDDAGCP